MRKNSILKILFIFFHFILLVPLFAAAQGIYFTEYNKTVRRLGAEGDRFYVDFVEPFGRDCIYGIAYVKKEHKGLYAQLLAAKLSGGRISRFDYEQPAGNGTACFVSVVELDE